MEEDKLKEVGNELRIEMTTEQNFYIKAVGMKDFQIYWLIKM